MRHIALGVNIGNLSRGPRAREPMKSRCDRINRSFQRDGTDLRVVAFHRHTGNLVLETPSVQPSKAALALSDGWQKLDRGLGCLQPFARQVGA